MKTLLYIVAVSLFLSNAVAQPDCTLAQVKESRGKFKKLFDKKEYKAAREVYAALDQQCSLLPDPEDKLKTSEHYYWIESERALSFFKEGDLKNCLQSLAPLLRPSGIVGYEQNGISSESAVYKAIENNNNLCEKATTSESEHFSKKPCPLPGMPKLTLASVELPAKENQSKVCLLLIEAKMGRSYYLKDDADDPKQAEACPNIVLAIQKSDKLELKSLKVKEDDGPLGEITSCCGLIKLGYQKVKENELIELSAESEQGPCGGHGTARFTPAATYKLRGDQLKLLKDNTVSSH